MSKREKKPNQKRAQKTDWPFVEAILASKLIRTIYLFGPPGLGKTYSAYKKGRHDRGVYAITLTEDTPAAELRGHYVPKGGELVWQDGPFTRAMREGARLVVNEISHGSPEAMSFLHPVLESAETAQLTLPTNETVRPAEGFHVVATDNCPPEHLPPALRDRFDSLIEITSPHPEALELLDDDLAQAAKRSFALDAERSVSLRGWFSVQRLRADLGLQQACVAVFGAERGAKIHEALVMAKCRLFKTQEDEDDAEQEDGDDS